MAQSLKPFLMFEGRAEEAMRLYSSLFPESEILELTHFAAGSPGPEGKLLCGRMRLLGNELRFFDSPIPHAFSFTPSISLFVECESVEELDTLFETLSEGGGVLMAPGSYGFSTKYAWLSDRFGVSWQLNFG